MVVALLVFVAVERIETNDLRTVRFFVAVDRIAVERVSDRQSLADRLLQMDRSDVIVVVVGSTAVATELIEFTHEIGVLTAIVERIEDRNAVRRDGDGSAQEVALRRLRSLGWHRMQRDLPGVLADVLLRQRHLLLPRGDADHHSVIGDPVRFDVEVAVVPMGLERLCF